MNINSDLKISAGKELSTSLNPLLKNLIGEIGKTFRKINIPGHMMIYIWIAWFQQYISSNIFYKAGTNCFGTK